MLSSPSMLLKIANSVLKVDLLMSEHLQAIDSFEWFRVCVD